MAVVNDTEWLDLLQKCGAFDGANAAAVVPHREATRLVSCSQEGSGAFVARLRSKPGTPPFMFPRTSNP